MSMLIGAGKQLNGLYFFRGMEAVAAIQGLANPPAEIWHRRLGHPSSKTLEKMAISDLSSSAFDSKICDICIRAKKTRDSFSSSINKMDIFF